MKTLTQHDQLLVKPYIDAKIKRVMEKIASVETSPTANSYSEGKYLIYNDIVYEVTTAISVGDTLVIYPATGYNIKVADDIMTMIETLRTENETLSNKVSNSDDAYSPSKAYKVGEYVIHDDVLYKCITACSAAAWSVNQSCFTEDTLTNAVSTINGVLNKKITVPLNTTDTWGQVGNKIANALSGIDLSNYLKTSITGGNSSYHFCLQLQSIESIGTIFCRIYTNPTSFATTIPVLCVKENSSSFITTKLVANEVSFIDYTNSAANLSSVDIHLQ